MPRTSMTMILGWGLLALLGFFVVESGFAVFRETVLTRQLGMSGARFVGLVQGELLLAVVAWLLFRALRLALTGLAVAAIAVQWLLVGALLEASIGLFFRNFSWREVVAGYDPTSGADSLIVAASLFLMPLLVGLVVLKSSRGQ